MPIIQKQIDKNNIKLYYEPFVGGANVIDKIRCERKIGNDIHKELIAMLKKIQSGWTPPEHISEEEYCRVRDNKSDYQDYYVGYVGFIPCFGARYFGGYARGFKSDRTTPRDYSNEAFRNIMKQAPNLSGIEFKSGNYLNENDICNAVIYCDPPYQNTTSYLSQEEFNHEKFWKWCRRMSKNNIVIVSEYNAPADFQCIWQKEHLANFDCNRNDDTSKKVRIEKLFTYNM